MKLEFNNNEWTLTSKNGDKFKSKYLICSTNLLLHKRSLKILNINQIPLRKAIPINKDKKIDLLLNLLDKQSLYSEINFFNLYKMKIILIKITIKIKIDIFILNKI